MLLFLSVVADAFAQCPSDAHERVLHAASRVEFAYANLDEPAMAGATTDLQTALPCVRTALSPPEATSVHRAMALISFYASDDARSRAAFASVRALQPAWQPTEGLMAQGTPLRALWDSSSTAETGATPPAYRPDGGWLVDGLSNADIPVGRPYVLQSLAEGGAVVATFYLWSSEIPDRSALGLDDASAVGRDATEAMSFRASALVGFWTASAAQEASTDVASVVTAEASGSGAAGTVALYVEPSPLVLIDAHGSSSFASADFVGLPLDFSGGVGVAVGPTLGSKLLVSPRVRVGGRLDRVGAWTTSSDAAAPATMPGLDLGVQAALESPRTWVLVGVTHTLGAAQIPFLTQVGADAQYALVGPVALAVHAGWSASGLSLESADGERVARRRESGLTASAGIGVAL